MRRWALYGGSFDPFHLGHLAVCRGLAELRHFDTIWVMPTGDAPHKDQANQAPAIYRYKMADLSLQELPEDLRTSLFLSDWEILQGGVSYTLWTLEAMKIRSPEPVELTLIGGSDVLKDIRHWYRPEEILALARLGIIHRPGHDDREDREALRQLEASFDHVQADFWPIKTPDASSTKIREAIAAGGDLGALPLAEEARTLIRERGLYQEDDAWRFSPEKQARILRCWQEAGFEEAFRCAKAPEDDAAENVMDAPSKSRSLEG